MQPERLERGLCPQGRRRLEPARADPEIGPLGLRPLLLGGRHPRWPRPGQLRRRQRLPRRPRPARRAEGLPATSIAWGLWAARERHDRAASARPTWRGCARRASRRSPTSRAWRSSTRALRRRAAPASGDARSTAPRLRALAAAGALPPILRGLVRTPQRRRAAGSSLAQRLADPARAAERERPRRSSWSAARSPRCSATPRPAAIDPEQGLQGARL